MKPETEPQTIPAVDPLSAMLAGLRWVRVRATVRNRRNRLAREAPAFVFRSMAMFAAHAVDGLRERVRQVPAREPWGDRVRKGRTYLVDFVLPGCGEEEGTRFLGALEAHLADETRNFELVDARCEKREVSSLLAEAAPVLEAARRQGELCLDFLSPCSFNPPGQRKRGAWRRLDGDVLRRLLERSVREFAGADLPGEWTLPEADVTVMDWWWRFTAWTHRPKTPRSHGGSDRQMIQGMLGPLYLRGDWTPWTEALALAAEWQLGNRPRPGCGRFILASGRACCDREIGSPALYLATLRHLRDECPDQADDLPMVEEDQPYAERLAARVRDAQWSPAPCPCFEVPKSSGGGLRRLALPPVEDRLVERAVNHRLTEAAERRLPRGVVGYRPGGSVDAAEKMIAQALRDGATHVAESDISRFFDAIPWEGMDAALDAFLPKADTRTRRLLAAVVRTPLVRGGGEAVARNAGILQGSPLSPLLSNLFLLPFDEGMEQAGHRMIRYGDDFVVLAAGAEAAAGALDDARRLLGALGLALKEEKTHAGPVDLGFRFLGRQMGDDLAGDAVRRAAMKKTLYIEQARAFVGVEGDAIVVRSKGEILARLPMERVGEVVVLGANSFSSWFLQACARRRIPISFCGPSGRYIGSFRPERREHFALAAAQWHKRASMEEADVTATARSLVEGKTAAYAAWLAEVPSPAVREAAAEARRLAKGLAGADTVDAVRGHEGNMAAHLFPVVHGMVRVDGFECEGRRPHQGCDRYNLLLDFGYHLLFTRINTLLRARGMNPYLGFLHSPEAGYESLVCDLQEPFRARVDRLVVRCINRGTVAAGQFETTPQGRWRLNGKGTAAFLQAFEREMETQAAGDPGPWRQLLGGQVAEIEQWARHPTAALRVYRAEGRSHR